MLRGFCMTLCIRLRYAKLSTWCQCQLEIYTLHDHKALNVPIRPGSSNPADTPLSRHTAWLQGISTNKALRLYVNMSLSWSPDHSWQCPPRQPQNEWLDQLRDDSSQQTDTSGSTLLVMDLAVQWRNSHLELNELTATPKETVKY